MRIAYQVGTGQLGLRGSEIALYDYAHFAEELLGHELIVCYARGSDYNDPSVIEKFSRRFRLVAYDDFAEIDGQLAALKVDAFYQMKGGANDGKLARDARNLVHAVFPSAPSERHGDVYAYISEWLSLQCSQGQLPFVPYIVTPPVAYGGDFRDALGIPRDAIVVGGYGGANSFNIPFVIDAVQQVAERRPDIWFLFMNFRAFCNRPRVLFMDGTSDPRLKAAFVDTCDAMLHARDVGETFGLACAEFSIRNKPIITYAHSPEAAHLHILGDRAITYADEADVSRILLEIDHAFVKSRDWDCYSKRFAPAPVMEKFKDVFL